MKEIFLQAYGTAWFAGAAYAIQATTMPGWGPFAIGGAAWMLGRIWTRALVPNA